MPCLESRIVVVSLHRFVDSEEDVPDGVELR
jgi:hypothetical protein